VSPSTIPEKYRRFNSDAPSEQGHYKQTQHLLCSNLLSKWYYLWMGQVEKAKQLFVNLTKKAAQNFCDQQTPITNR